MEPIPLIISPLSRCALGQAGGIGGTNLSSVAYPTANVAMLVPFRVLTAMPVKQVWWMQGATVAGNVDVGVYNLDARLLLSGGAVAQSVAGVSAIGQVTFSTPTILYPGGYYLAVACSSATGTFYQLPALSGGLNSWKMLGLAQVASNMPLADNPTLATFVGGGTPRVPYFGICSELLF